MQTKILLTTLTSSLLSLASGHAAVNARAALESFAPPIISPNNSTIWVVGSVETVTWNTSGIPINAFFGEITLRSAEALTPSFIIADGFDLGSGAVNVTVPDTSPGEFEIILFGDSGDISQPFQIVAA